MTKTTTARTTTGTDQDRDEACSAEGADLVELRLDTVLDLTERGLGIRSRRYSMIVDDGVVSQINLEEGGGFEVSDAGTILNQL